MTGEKRRTLEEFCDDARYPAMTDAQLSECIATIRAFSQGQPVRLESESWFGNFRRLLPMYWKYRQDAEYWESWQDPDKIKKLEAENADLLAIAQGQREELERLRECLIDDDAMMELAWAKYFNPLNGPAEPFAAGRMAMLRACRATINAIGTKK